MQTLAFYHWTSRGVLDTLLLKHAIFSLLLNDRVGKRWLYLQDSWTQRSEHPATDWPQCGAVVFSGGQAKHCSIVQREGVNSALALAFILRTQVWDWFCDCWVCTGKVVWWDKTESLPAYNNSVGNAKNKHEQEKQKQTYFRMLGAISNEHSKVFIVGSFHYLCLSNNIMSLYLKWNT